MNMNINKEIEIVINRFKIGDYNFEPSQITKQLMEDYISLVNT